MRCAETCSGQFDALGVAAAAAAAANFDCDMEYVVCDAREADAEWKTGDEESRAEGWVKGGGSQGTGASKTQQEHYVRKRNSRTGAPRRTGSARLVKPYCILGIKLCRYRRE